MGGVTVPRHHSVRLARFLLCPPLLDAPTTTNGGAAAAPTAAATDGAPISPAAAPPPHRPPLAAEATIARVRCPDASGREDYAEVK